MRLTLTRAALAAGILITCFGASLQAQTITISPGGYITVGLGATRQFSAQVSGLSGTGVTWSVGRPGMNAGLGAINSAGLYTAPTVLPSNTQIQITATSSVNPAVQGVTYLYLLAAGPVISSVTPNPIPSGTVNLTIHGTGFLPGASVKLGGVQLTTTSVVRPPLPLPAISRRRPLPPFCHQCEFQSEQYVNGTMPTISNYNGLLGSSQGGMPAYFLANAVSNADQLRQRVAFALSQIFVTSINKIIWNGDMIPYQHLLLADAFTNYRQILGDVTLSPAMGEYLDMANNAKANPAAGTVANENYAREIMQLFSIGTTMLNPDGSIQVDSTGAPIPTYLQTNVTELARVFTGWTYPPKTPGGQPVWNAYINSSGPMVSYSAMHDYGSKTLLNGYVAAANLTPQQDLQGALDNLAGHSNVAPFISKQLIQHLVKSNPTSSYVQRVSTTFTQSGGDMKSVIFAILLDPEARANDAGGNDQPSDGHLQEPALMLPAFIRAFGGQMTTANYYASDMAALGEDIYNPPSVFNYYSPGYTVAGTGGLKGPEFQINNPNATILRENLIGTFFNQYSNPIQSYGPGTTVDLTPFLPLASTPATLVDALDLTLTHGVMPATMKQIIVNAVTADAGGNLHRVQTGIYLILTSSYYNVWH